MSSKSKKSPIPLIRPLIPKTEDIGKYLERSRKANTFSNFGPNYNLAVEMLNLKTSRYVTPVTNGTVAIQLAAQTVLEPKSRVVIPDYTHIGTYVGIRDAGMIPILSKCNPFSWTLDLNPLRQKIDFFDAFVVVSPFGYLVNTAPYEEFAAKYKKKIIYDFAGAWGQFPKTKFPVTYSLHATKSWSCGEGGLVSFSSMKEYEKCRRMTTFNIGPDYSIASDIGGNFKLDEIRCAMIVAHMKNYSEILLRQCDRVMVMSEYEKHFGAVPSCESTTLAVMSNMFDVVPDDLKHMFITKFYFPLLTRMPHLKHVKTFSESDDSFTGNLAIPIDVTKKEQEFIIKGITDALRR